MHREERKCFLNVLTDCYEEFIQLMCGGTNWNCMYFYSKYCFSSSDNSFYMMFCFGVNSRFINLS